MKIGINVFGLQNELNANIPSVFQKLHTAGFDEVELLIWPDRKQGKLPASIATEESVGQIVHYANENGLSVYSAHVLFGIGPFFAPVKDIVRTIRVCAQKHGIHQFVFSRMFTTAKAAKRFAKYMNRISEATRDLDRTLLYHNHSQEFASVSVDGKAITALEYFFTLTNPDILLQLDIGWAGIGGDEVEIAQKFTDKIASLHLKDFIPGTRSAYQTNNMPKENFCAIGCGEIQTAKILSMRDTFPNYRGGITIDQDHSSGNILEDAVTGYKNIVSMLEKGDN